MRKFGVDKVRGWRLSRFLVLRGRGWRAFWFRVVDAFLFRFAFRVFFFSKLVVVVISARVFSFLVVFEFAICAGSWRSL